MGRITLADVAIDLESLAGWTGEIRSAISGMEPGTVLVGETANWRQNPPTTRPPRTTICFRCIEETKTTVTAQDLLDALTKMEDWLTSLKADVAEMGGLEA